MTNCTFHTEGSNSYSASHGTIMLKVRLNGEGWLDPSTVRLMFDVMNTDSDDTRTLKPIGYCHGFFRRLRISVRGQIIPDIQDSNMVSHMFNSLENPQTRLNDMCEGFGYFGDINVLDAIVQLPGISRDSYQTVMFKSVGGLFNHSKYLPLRNMPIELNLELADYDAPITTTFNDVFTAPNTIISWRLQHCQSTCDILTLDNSLDNSDVNHSLGGKTLQLVYDTYISSTPTITSADTQANVSRSLTALRSVFMSFDKTFAADRITWHNKSWNTFV